MKSERKSNVQLDASGRRDMMDGQQREPGDNTIRLDLETEDGKKQEIILDDRGNLYVLLREKTCLWNF